MSFTPPLESIINMFLQLVILAVVTIGVVFAKRRSFQFHERIMSLAMVLVVISLVWWMGISLIENFNVLTESPFATGSLITIFHVIFGVLTTVLTVTIVYKRIRASSHIRFRVKNRKTLMRATLLLWLITFALGLSFYLFFFVL